MKLSNKLAALRAEAETSMRAMQEEMAMAQRDAERALQAKQAELAQRHEQLVRELDEAEQKAVDENDAKLEALAARVPEEA